MPDSGGITERDFQFESLCAEVGGTFAKAKHKRVTLNWLVRESWLPIAVVERCLGWLESQDYARQEQSQGKTLFYQDALALRRFESWRRETGWNLQERSLAERAIALVKEMRDEQDGPASG